MEIYLIVIGRTATVTVPTVLMFWAAQRSGKRSRQWWPNMKQALELHFEGMVEDGDAVPRPRGLDSYREVMKDLDLNEYFLAHVQIDTSRFAASISRP